MMSLQRLKWLTAIVVSVFLVIFEYVRHVQFPQLLHNWSAYLVSVGIVFILLWLGNEFVFRAVRQMQLDLLRRNDENARLNAELVQQANYLNTVIDSSGNAIITLDKEGKILSWNRAAEDIYGWRKDETIGRRFPMVPPSMRDEAVEIMGRIWAGETLRNFETKRLRADGTVIPVLLTASPVRDASGDIVSVIGISTDLRDRKRLEDDLMTQQRVLATLQERERLARELHDGLGQVLGFVNTQSQAVREFLARGQADAAQACLKEMTDVARDAHADVREYILSLKTHPAGAQPFVPALREYLARFGQSAGIQVELAAEAGLDHRRFDPAVEAQLMRIVQEALTNARKHAQARKITVGFEAANGVLHVSVEDDGRGFETADAPGEAGNHFGLRIMRDRAADVGGRVQVTSAPGRGTQVLIDMPAQLPGGTAKEANGASVAG